MSVRVDSTTWNVYQCVRDYITHMLSHNAINNTGGMKMKSLLLDHETTKIISMVYSQSEVIQKQVVLVENIEKLHEWIKDQLQVKQQNEDKLFGDTIDTQQLHHFIKETICFLTPSKRTLECLQTLFHTSRYKEYYIFFNNILPDGYLEALAEIDQHDVIKQVHEYYSDFYPVTPTLFHFNNFNNNNNNTTSINSSPFSARDIRGLLSVLLSLKKKPDIRYDANSDIAKKIAFTVMQKMKDETELFTFKKNDPCLLLIMDRREDPVTPLLTQWTYQAMVHELLGIQNNRIDMCHVKNNSSPQDMKELILNSQEDQFFRNNMFSTYYDVATRVKKVVADYQVTTKSNTNLETIEDMQQFIEKFPQYKAMSGNITKHMALMTEISHIISSRNLMEVSKIEQEIVCGNEHDVSVEQIKGLLSMKNVQFEDKLRVVMIYAIRYEKEKTNQLNTLRNQLQRIATTPNQAAKIITIDKLLQYVGKYVRKNELKVDNVFTQHKPYVFNLLNQLFSGSDLHTQMYPFVDKNNDGSSKTQYYKKVIVFITGGVTYEELVAIDAINKKQKIQVLLGGSYIHNSTSFLNEVPEFDAAKIP